MGNATIWSRSGGDVSGVLYNFLYESTCQKIHTQFFLEFLYFSFLSYNFFKKEIATFKIWKNLHKSYKIYENFLFILEKNPYQILEALISFLKKLISQKRKIKKI